jgi:hypothetical protein
MDFHASIHSIFIFTGISGNLTEGYSLRISREKARSVLDSLRLEHEARWMKLSLPKKTREAHPAF